MKKSKPSLGNYYKLPNPGLWAYFNRTKTGNDEDYRPPLFNKEPREAVLARWESVLASLHVSDKFPDLYNYEMEMKSKVGPMSIQLPLDDRIPSIEQYFTMVEQPGKPISKEAIDATIKFFKPAGGLRIRSRERTIEKMRLSTNSGTPFFTKRRNVVEETLNYNLTQVFGDFSDNWRGLSKTKRGRGGIIEMRRKYHDDGYLMAATLGWRGQEGGISDDDVKQRVIWMMPFLLNVIELQFYQPAVEAVQAYRLIPAYISMDAVDQEVTRLFDTKGKDDPVVCTDFTAFDQHFNKHMQEAAYKVELALCGDSASKKHLNDMFGMKFTIPLICSDELMYEGPHGMGSGSGGTNFDECMAHKALQFEAAQTANATLNPHSMAYGDDGILTYPGIDVKHVIQTYTDHGQEMNASKQYVSKHDCVVLRRWHGMDYRVNGIMVGVYSTFRALGRLLAQERYYDPEKWSKEMVILRTLSILENCKWSPYFHEFIDFVMTGDKYKLGLEIPGFFDSLYHLAKEATNEFQDFLGYTKTLQEDANDAISGITNWEVVKYLRSKQTK